MSPTTLQRRIREAGSQVGEEVQRFVRRIANGENRDAVIEAMTNLRQDAARQIEEADPHVIAVLQQHGLTLASIIPAAILSFMTLLNNQPDEFGFPPDPILDRSLQATMEFILRLPIFAAPGIVLNAVLAVARRAADYVREQQELARHITYTQQAQQQRQEEEARQRYLYQLQQEQLARQSIGETLQRHRQQQEEE